MKNILDEMLKTERETVVAARKELEALEKKHADVVAGKGTGKITPMVAELIDEKRKAYFDLAGKAGAWRQYFKNHPERTMFLWAKDYVHETNINGEGHKTLLQLAKELNVAETSKLFAWAKTLSPKAFVEKVGPIAYRPQPVSVIQNVKVKAKQNNVIQSAHLFIKKQAVAGA